MESIELKTANNKAHLKTIKDNIRVANEELSRVFKSIEDSKQDLRLAKEDARVARGNLSNLNSLMESELREIAVARDGLAKQQDRLEREREEHALVLSQIGKDTTKAKAELEAANQEIQAANEKLREIPSQLDGLDAIREKREEVVLEIGKLEKVVNIANQKLQALENEEKDRIEKHNREVSFRDEKIKKLDEEIEAKSRALDGHGSGLREYEDSLKKREKNLRIYANRLRSQFKKLGINMPNNL